MIKHILAVVLCIMVLGVVIANIVDACKYYRYGYGYDEGF